MLKNTAQFNTYELITLFGVENTINLDSGWSCRGVTTDSREIEEGNLFIALKGEKFDGHDMVSQAFESGAGACLVSRSWFKANKAAFGNSPFILVDNTLKTLGQLANYHRKRFNYPVIAIAGSNGKTTTKEITAHILSVKFKVLKTHANYNNQVGVPLMLLAMTDDFEAAIIEIGTNEPGEIAILSDILAPTHGIITNIGEEHLEKLIDLTGVEMEETYLFGYLRKHNGTAFINMDDERLSKYDFLLENKVRFGTAVENNVSAEIKYNENFNPILKISFDGEEILAALKTIGRTTALNALSASAIAYNLGLKPSEIKNALELYSHDQNGDYGRMKMEIISGIKLINDCYNANPSSMKAALEILADFRITGKKYAVLGDMLELGDSSLEKHIEIIESALAVTDNVFLFGTKMKLALQSSGNDLHLHFAEKSRLAEALKNSVIPGDLVLIKGSRGMKMEEVVLKLREIFGD